MADLLELLLKALWGFVHLFAEGFGGKAWAATILVTLSLFLAWWGTGFSGVWAVVVYFAAAVFLLLAFITACGGFD